MAASKEIAPERDESAMVEEREDQDVDRRAHGDAREQRAELSERRNEPRASGEDDPAHGGGSGQRAGDDDGEAPASHMKTRVRKKERDGGV